jgi:thiol-disulfide isomerase/thioredoxin
MDHELNMNLQKLDRISIVLATWCPHCVPLSLENAKKMAEEIRVPLRVLDIDQPESAKIADELVSKYGDDCEDYLIPQVFLEFSTGSIRHVFTGFSENTEITRRHWGDFFESKFYKELKMAS